MARRIVLAALLATALAVPGPALASHTGQYGLNPVEHDDQGRGIEPDNQATAVLGPLLVNKVFDPTGTGSGAVADPFPNALPPPPTGHSTVINPGCMGDGPVPATGHNRLSGQCGLWTAGAGLSLTGGVVPRHTVPAPASEDGRCEGPGATFPPGRYSGNTCPGNTVRFLDSIQHACESAGGVHYIEVNRKVDDSPLAGTLVGTDFVAGPTCIWTWYGAWQDKNGNGVIDHRASFNTVNAQGECPRPCDGVHNVAQEFPDEEFTWYGVCYKFGSPPSFNPNALLSGYCRLDVEAAEGGTTRMAGWFWPGNHHAYCGGTADPLFATCFYFPADLPGRQAIHLAGAAANTLTGVPGPCAGLVGFICSTNPEQFDDFDELFLGDPLLGPQGGVRADQEFGDRAGDPALTTRQWVYGLGWAVYFYDSSLLQRLVQVTGVGCPEGGANTFLVDQCRFRDVDKFDTWSPTAESLLRETVKPLARQNWVFVRDRYIPTSKTIDGVVNNARLSTDGTLGPLNDQTQDPGFGREPNEPGDAYPAAAFNAAGCALPSKANGFQDGTRLHQGWCNDYSPHRAGPRAYADLLHIRVLHENRPVIVNTLTVLGVSGVFAATTLNPEAPADSDLPLVREPGDHRRTLGPGKYIFGGVAGQWHDQPHTWVEDVLVPVPELDVVDSVRTAPPDGWVGNLVENIGAWYYRGYHDAPCETDQPAWAGAAGDLHSHAECHPYRDGLVQNPQAYGIGEVTSPSSKVVEWRGRCDTVGHGGDVPLPQGVPGAGVVTLTPLDGRWDVPVLVWRDHGEGVRVTTDPVAVSGVRIVELTGTVGPIELKAGCSAGALPGAIGVSDLLVLPLGNQEEPFTVDVTTTVAGEPVTDVDTFHAWGLL